MLPPLDLVASEASVLILHEWLGFAPYLSLLLLAFWHWRDAVVRFVEWSLDAMDSWCETPAESEPLEQPSHVRLHQGPAKWR